jgi:putative SOS response-associated peptidase YedK
MCGRFTLNIAVDVLTGLFDMVAEPSPPPPPRYNIAPSQPLLLVRAGRAAGSREWAFALWGFIPAWSKDPLPSSGMINARSETAAQKPMFRAAMRRRRCLIPATGFYEWQKLGTRKQPHLIRMADGSPFAFAGLWDHWIGADGSELETCAILTTEPNELMKPIHNRMPAILPKRDFEEWLDPAQDNGARAAELLRPYPAGQMDAYPVHPVVNNPRNDSPECVAPAGLL